MRLTLFIAALLVVTAATSQPAEKFSLASGQTTPTWYMLHQVKFIPNRDLVCVLGDDNLVVWDYRKNVALKEFSASAAFAINETGDRLAFASRKGIEMWKVPEMTFIFAQPTPAEVRLIEFSRDSKFLYYNTCYGEEVHCNVFHSLDLTSQKISFERKLDADSYSCIEAGGKIIVGGERSIVILDRTGNIAKKIKDPSLQLVCRFDRMPGSEEVAFYSDLNLLPQSNNKSLVSVINPADGRIKKLGAIPGLDAYVEAFLLNGSVEQTKKFVADRSAMEHRDAYDLHRSKFDFDTDKKLYVELANYGTMLLLRSLTDHHIIKTIGWSGHSGESIVRAAGNLVVHQFAGNVIVWDLVKLKPLYSLSAAGKEDVVNFGVDSVDKKLFIRRSLNAQLVLQTVELTTGRLLNNRTLPFKDAISISSKGDIVARGDRNISFSAADKPAVSLYSEKGIYDNTQDIIWINDHEAIAAVSNLMSGKQNTPILNVDTEKKVVETLREVNVEFISSLSVDGDIVAWVEDLSTIVLFDRVKKKVIFSKTLNDPLGIAFALGRPGELFAYANGTIALFDTSTGAERWKLSFPDGATSLHVAGNLNRLIAATPSGKLHVIDVKDESHHIVLSATDERSYCVYTPQGFYKASPAVRKGISILHEGRLLTGESTGTYERPDKVMEASGFSDNWIRNLYKRMYDTGPPAPTLKMTTNLQSFPLETDKASLLLEANCEGTSMHVAVNGIPVFGEDGMNIKNSSFRADLVLYPGANRIKCYCSKGDNTSEIDYTEVVSNQSAATGKIYFAGFAVSKFSDTTKNLRYPRKDIRDLVSVLRRVSVLAGRTFEADTLFEKNFNEGGLKKIKKKIEGLKQEDIVILHYSGHGMLDDDHNFYLSTSSTNFNDLSKGSLDYRRFEDLLDSVAPQHRLILLDACHSGAEQDRIMQKNVSKGAKGGGYDAVEVFQTSVEEYYAMSMNNSGNFVLGATSRAGRAYELDSLKNGLFTKAIMEGLRSTGTDADGDKLITVSELRKYVENYVLQFSKGTQKPSTRNENINSDFVIRNMGNR